MVYNSVKDFHMALVTGDNAGSGVGLTAWRNADAKYVSAECIPCDIPLGWGFKPPVHDTTQVGAMTTGRVGHRLVSGVSPGVWRSRHAFQTCQFIFWIMQTTGTPTTEGTPAGYNTHALTIGNTTAPIWHGIHFERESISGAELRYDMMGLLPSDLTINCGESAENWAATQEIIIPYAFLQDTCDDIAAQTQRNPGTTGAIWKCWDHAITGNGGGLDPSGLQYGDTPANLEVDIRNITIRLHRDVSFHAADTSGYNTIGLMGGWNYEVELDVIPIGDLLYDVNQIKKEDFEEFDYTFSFTADATNDKITFTFDKMYMIPFDEVNDYHQWFEGYTITLVPIDTTSSLAVSGIDNLDNTHFENP